MSKIKELNLNNFSSSIDSGFSLLDFRADWCPPCKMMDPILEKMSEDPELTNINFFSIDVDNNQELAQKYDVTGIPTFIIMENGIETTRLVGLQRFKEMKETIAKIIN